jgi:ATP-dependent protease ClpP protease subunit
MQNKNNTEEDNDLEKLINGDEADIFYNERPIAHQREYWFYDEIAEPKKYLNLIRQLNSCDSNDQFDLHFCCDGGRMDSMQTIITAIRKCRGRVVGHLDSHASSAGSLLFLSCDMWNISREGFLMFHDFSGGLFGKGNEMTSQLSHYVKNFEMIMDQICFPFFSKAEIKSICNGQDRWIDSVELAKRLTILGKHRQKPVVKK